jgi:hypothetical protein
MIQRPNAVGLILCESVLIEEGTNSVTLLRCFDRLAARTFPTPPRQFTVFAVLTDGLGPVRLSVNVNRLETDEEIHAQNWRTEFREPLAQVRLPLKIHPCSFPEPGRYDIVLYAEGEAIARVVLTVAAMR